LDLDPGRWLLGVWLVRPTGEKPRLIKFSQGRNGEKRIECGLVEVAPDGKTLKPVRGPDGNYITWNGTYSYGFDADNNPFLTLTYEDGRSVRMQVVSREAGQGGEIDSALMIAWGPPDQGWQFERTKLK
jgi:hypothetical protein